MSIDDVERKALTREIEHRAWGSVLQRISSNPLMCGTRLNCPACNSCHSILHFICHYRPPTKIVQLLLSYPKSLNELDCMSQNALHIAIKSGCNVEVINMILNKKRTLAGSTEQNGNYPLHLAFHEYKNGMRFHNKILLKHRQRRLKSILKILCAAEPLALVAEDQNGMSIVEYAIVEELSTDIVMEVMKQAEKARKQQIQRLRTNTKRTDVRMTSFESVIKSLQSLTMQSCI